MITGSLVAIALLNTVPATDVSISGLLKSTARRMTVAAASSVTAGYITPAIMTTVGLNEALMLGSAFIVGGGAQQFLAGIINRFVSKIASPTSSGE